MRNVRFLTTSLALLALLAAPVSAYTVYLKDGSTIIARGPYHIEGDNAIITLQNGTRSSIQASEIDVARTREANQSDYGSAVVLQDGQLTELPSEPGPPPKKDLSDIVGSGPTAHSRPQARRPTPADSGSSAPKRTAAGYLDYLTAPRMPYRDLEVSSQLQRTFRAQGVEEVLIYQGTEQGHLLVDVTANSEASIFRSLKVAALALLRIREGAPGTVEALELVLATSNREPGGQFLITPPIAQELVSDEVEISRFFIENVRF